MNWLFDFIDVATFWTILLIVHGLLSVALLGGLTHQAAAAWASPPSNRRKPGFVDHFGRVRAEVYTNAVCVLWITTFVVGGWIYAEYRVAIRVPMEQAGYWKTQGMFELKEHLATIGLLLLPFYWNVWSQQKPSAVEGARRWTTTVLAALAWYAFLMGHVANNVRGFGS